MNFYSVGYFGAPNLGDELLCKCVVNRLREAHAANTVYIMTRSAEVSRRYTGLDGKYVEGYWPEPEYFQNLCGHLRAVSDSSLVVIGGGGLIADYYSWSSIPRYCIDALWAILAGRRYVFVGLGVREVSRWWLRQVARFVCTHAGALYCRDKGSAERLKELTRCNHIRTGPDLAYLAKIHAYEGSVDRDYALINVRERPPIDREKLSEFCRELLQGVGGLVLLSAEKPDTDYYKRVVDDWDAREQAATRIVEPKSLNESIEWIQAAKFVAAERLHVNILAVRTGRRLLSINYEDKVKQFIDMLSGEPLVCSLEELGAQQAKRLLASGIPRWSVSPGELEAWAKRIFDEIIRGGLAEHSCGLWVRFIAGAYLFALMGFGVLYSAAVLVKRAVFGRGPLRLSVRL